ncbi:hypothetical protein ZIOFF_019167 [Zingiber officinale]|uniref:Complex 1 LYR protein domain-containing protein n=1 Tax=Zingiber officinale TaxID=94328 RepID=A0A8J5HLM4_ZINOF|nr:hypothetical protein ZIOFF_019167 [Zingiber officinale]
MVLAPSRVEVLSLFRSLLRTASKFADYNIREYAKRRTIDGFRDNRGLSDPSSVALAFADGKSQFEVVKRQVTVYSLYAPKVKSVMEVTSLLPSCTAPNALCFKFKPSSPSCTGDDTMAICWEEMEITRMRRKIMKEARRSMPELGAGRVMYLVRAFERLLSLSQQIKTAGVGVGAGKKKGMLTLTTMDLVNWALFQSPEEIFSEEDYNYPFSPVSPELESHEANFAARFSFASVGESDAAERKTGLSKKRWIKKLKVRKQKTFKKRIEMKLYFLKRSRMACGLARMNSNWRRLNLGGVLSQCSFDRDHNIPLATADDEKTNSVQPDLNTKLASCKEDSSDKPNNASSCNPESDHATSSRKSNKWIYYIKGGYHRNESISHIQPQRNSKKHNAPAIPSNRLVRLNQLLA